MNLYFKFKKLKLIAFFINGLKNLIKTLFLCTLLFKPCIVFISNS